MTDEHSVSSSSSESGKKSNSINLKLDLRWVIVGLLVIIVLMFGVWRPWGSQVNDQSRTVSVTGDAKLKATPDEYVFSPSYQFKNTDKDAALKAVTDKQTEVVTGLKNLGVADSKIKANSSGYDYNYYFDESADTYNYTLSLTVTLSDKALTQKVQDYLVTTSPSGAVSPQANFSDAKRKTLESKARDQATKDARAKADQSAKNLGFKVGKVKSVNDGTGFGTTPYCSGTLICPMAADSAAGSGKSSVSSLPVQTGENELDYSVTVVYYVK
jgi:uncharacterized protein YggE